jgi:outer membrane protein assembly factor BamB
MPPRRPWLCWLAVALLAPPARADETLTRIVLPGESPSAAQRLESARKLAHDGQLTEAVDEYQRLLEEAGDKLAPLSERHLVQVRWLCHLDLAALPPEGRRLYRNRVDAQARKWFEQGTATRDAALLRRVVDEAFCSRVGDRALDALGDLAFERGAFVEAERWWARIVPPADRDPHAARPLELVFPDPQVDVARARAKQLLARLFRPESEVDSAAVAEALRAYRRLHPDAAGPFAGRTGKYADTLQALLERRAALAPEAPGWTTFGGSPSRNLVLPAGPSDPNRLARLVPRWRFRLETHDRLDDNDVPGQPGPPGGVKGPGGRPAGARALAFHPLVVDGQALVADTSAVSAYDLRTGRSSVWYDAGAELARLNLANPQAPAAHDLRYTLTAADGCVFARLGAPCFGPESRPADCDSLLVCLSVRPDSRGERLRWRARPEAGPRECAVFEGAPVAADGRVYVAVTRFTGGRNITAVHCYPARAEGTPPLRWRQDACETPELGGKDVRCRHHLLTLAGPNVVYCSHSGAIVALDAVTGRHVWARRYPSRGSGTEEQPSPRDLAPPVYAGGRLFVAPADYDRLLCLDPATGQLLWQRDKVEVVHLLGVGHGRLIFTTPQGIRAVSAATGSDGDGWAEPDVGDLPPFGRGFLAGGLVFWPTRSKLYVLDQADGQQPDDVHPGPWQEIPLGNLAYGDGCLVVAGAKVLTVYGPPAPPRPEREEERRPQPVPAQLPEAPDASPPESGRCGAAAPPDLALPLLHAWQAPLAAGEALLPAHVAGAAPPAVPDDGAPDLAVFARAGAVTFRDAGCGRVLWTCALPFDAAWSGRHRGLVLLAGPGGVRAVRRQDGAAAWSYPAPAGGALSDFRLTASRLFFLQGGRRLVALDAATGRRAWTAAAPSAGLGLPYPSGRFRTYQAGEDWVVAQTAGGKLRVLDSRTGRLAHQLDTTREPWPGPPLALDRQHFCLVPDGFGVVLLDAAAGKELARPALVASTTLSGTPPLAVGAGDVLLVIADRNFGPTLQRFDPLTGQALWPEERVLGTETVAADGVAFDREAVYGASGDVLSALALADGRQLWRAILPFAPGGRRHGKGKPGWRTLRTRQYLVAYPGDVGARVVGCRSLFGSFLLAAAFPLHERRAVGFPVLFYDPRTGQLVQRVNVRTGGPQIAVRGPLQLGAPAVPRLRFEEQPVMLQVSGRGLVAAGVGMAMGRAFRP